MEQLRAVSVFYGKRKRLEPNSARGPGASLLFVLLTRLLTYQALMAKDAARQSH